MNTYVELNYDASSKSSNNFCCMIAIGYKNSDRESQSYMIDTSVINTSELPDDYIACKDIQ
jgi:hypothetical protein